MVFGGSRQSRKINFEMMENFLIRKAYIVAYLVFALFKTQLLVAH